DKRTSSGEGEQEGRRGGLDAEKPQQCRGMRFLMRDPGGGSDLLTAREQHSDSDSESST
ncbi:uncharacterized, partial [Tachysurus ichikawai]